MVWGSGNNVIVAVSETLLSPVTLPKELHGGLQTFMSHVKRWADQALKTSTGWGSCAFPGLECCLGQGARK